MEHIFEAQLFDAEAVASTGAKTTASLDTKFLSRIESLALKAVSASGDADVKVEYQTSQDDSNWDAAADNDDITSSQATQFANNKEGWNHIDMVTHLSRYIRFVVTGVGSNPADTLVSLKAICRESIGSRT
jgi:hypothetical protein